MIKKRFQNSFGFVDYIYKIDSTYPKGLFLFMGSYINKQCRNSGKFKAILKELFSTLPNETVIQVGTINKDLINFFLRLDFKKVDYIEYWGNTDNTVKMEGILTSELIKII